MIKDIIVQVLNVNKPISCYYDGLFRIIEIHAVDVSKTGNLVFRGYQVGGN